MDNITVKSSGNTIKLQSTTDEVTGGYFDSEEVWHEFGGGGGSSEFVRVTIKLIDANVRELAVNNTLYDVDTEEPVSAYPESFNLNISTGQYTLNSEKPEATMLVPKNIVFGGTQKEYVSNVEGTVKMELVDNEYLFYADEDSQTLTITFVPIT